jgi:alkaline phosphatase
VRFADGLERALGAIISARARLGWTTWGHTGVDVLVYATGPGRTRFTGSLENMALGQRVASLMGWDLDEETEALGTLVFAPHEHAPNTRPTTPWE